MKQKTEFKCIRVPSSLHSILLWMSLIKKKHIYEVVAELLYIEMQEHYTKGDTNDRIH